MAENFNAQTALQCSTAIFAESTHRFEHEKVIGLAEHFLAWLDSKDVPDEQDRQLDFAAATERSTEQGTLDLHADSDKEPLYRKAGF